MAFVIFLVCRDFCSIYLALYFWQEGTPSLVSIPFLIFVPFEGSSSSCPCCIEGFFLELLPRMPSFILGHPVECLSCLASVYAMLVLWLLPFCCMKGFFLEPLCTCPLYLGASSGVPVYLASVVHLQFFSSCPCYIEDFFLELLVHMPTLFWGIQWSTYQSGPPSCDFLLAAPASCYTEGFFLEPLFAHACFILGHPVECLSVWPPSCDFFLATFILGVFLGYHRIDPPFIHASVCWSFLSDISLQTSLSSRPGSWLSPEGSVFLPSLLAFS